MREAVFARFRSRWLEWMTDTLTITGPAARTYNRSTGEYDEVAGASRYSGIGRVFRRALTDSEEVVIGEMQRSLRQFELILPHDTTGIQIDDQVTITASDDSALVGVTGRVFHVEAGGWNETRRCYFEETLV